MIEEAKSRLKLTPEQKPQLKPIVEDRNQKLKAIRDKYAGDSSRRAKRAMFKEAQPIRRKLPGPSPHDPERRTGSGMGKNAGRGQGAPQGTIQERQWSQLIARAHH